MGGWRMTELKGSRFTGILPERLRSREAEALAYAVGRQVEALLSMAEAVPFYACLEAAPEPVLDCMAAELRTPAYSDVFPPEVKRALIRNSLPAYAKMGTPEAVDRTLASIFGAGHIEEWFDYGGEPHHFRAVIRMRAGVTQESLEEFRRILTGVKRLSSWLDGIITVLPMDPAPASVSPGMGGLFSSVGLPAAEPRPAPAGLAVSPGIGGFASQVRPPDAPPVFHGDRTLRASAALGGCLTVTALPLSLRPAGLTVVSHTGGGFSVTALPEIRQGGTQ